MRIATGFAIAGVWTALAAALPALAESDPCPAIAVGVHDIAAGTSTTYIAVAKATPQSVDEGAFALAEAEARLEARRSLMSHLAPDLKQMRFSGLVDVAVCRTNGEVFATLRLDEANVRRAAKMQDIMRESLRNTPPAKP